MCVLLRALRSVPHPPTALSNRGGGRWRGGAAYRASGPAGEGWGRGAAAAGVSRARRCASSRGLERSAGSSGSDAAWGSPTRRPRASLEGLTAGSSPAGVMADVGSRAWFPGPLRPSPSDRWEGPVNRNHRRRPPTRPPTRPMTTPRASQPLVDPRKSPERTGLTLRPRSPDTSDAKGPPSRSQTTQVPSGRRTSLCRAQRRAGAMLLRGRRLCLREGAREAEVLGARDLFDDDIDECQRCSHRSPGVKRLIAARVAFNGARNGLWMPARGPDRFA